MKKSLLSAEKWKFRKCIWLLKDLQLHMIFSNIPNVDIQELAMGMSGVREIAIEEGAMIIRIATAIFGDRGTADSYYSKEKIHTK